MRGLPPNTALAFLLSRRASPLLTTSRLRSPPRSDSGLAICAGVTPCPPAGYRDLRNVTPNGDGTFSAQGVRTNPPGTRPGSQPEVKVDIDASGNIKER